MSKLKPYMPYIFIGLIMSYGGIQYLTGTNGYFSQTKRKAELLSAEQKLIDLRAQRAELEVRAHFLSKKTMSRELLRERARLMLGVGEQDVFLIRDHGETTKTPPSAQG